MIFHIHPFSIFAAIWSNHQKKVAVDCTRPNGRVLGVDIIPAQPPKGASTIQGNFLSPEVQNYVQDFLRDPKRGRPYQGEHPDVGSKFLESKAGIEGLPEMSKISETRQSDLESKPVDVVLSDMSAPWYQTSGFWKRSLSEPYNRMMNTSGVIFRDHAGSMVCVSCDAKYLVFPPGLTITFTIRTFAMLHCNLAWTSSKPVVILSANSTRGKRIKSSKTSSGNCFREFTD